MKWIWTILVIFALISSMALASANLTMEVVTPKTASWGAITGLVTASGSGDPSFSTTSTTPPLNEGAAGVAVGAIEAKKASLSFDGSVQVVASTDEINMTQSVEISNPSKEAAEGLMTLIFNGHIQEQTTAVLAPNETQLISFTIDPVWFADGEYTTAGVLHTAEFYLIQNGTETSTVMQWGVPFLTVPTDPVEQQNFALSHNIPLPEVQQAAGLDTEYFVLSNFMGVPAQYAVAASAANIGLDLVILGAMTGVPINALTLFAQVMAGNYNLEDLATFDAAIEQGLTPAEALALTQAAKIRNASFETTYTYASQAVGANISLSEALNAFANGISLNDLLAGVTPQRQAGAAIGRLVTGLTGDAKLGQIATDVANGLLGAGFTVNADGLIGATVQAGRLGLDEDKIAKAAAVAGLGNDGSGAIAGIVDYVDGVDPAVPAIVVRGGIDNGLTPQQTNASFATGAPVGLIKKLTDPVLAFQYVNNAVPSPKPAGSGLEFVYFTPGAQTLTQGNIISFAAPSATSNWVELIGATFSSAFWSSLVSFFPALFASIPLPTANEGSSSVAVANGTGASVSGARSGDVVGAGYYGAGAGGAVGVLGGKSCWCSEAVTCQCSCSGSFDSEKLPELTNTQPPLDVGIDEFGKIACSNNDFTAQDGTCDSLEDCYKPSACPNSEYELTQTIQEDCEGLVKPACSAVVSCTCSVQGGEHECSQG